MTLIVKFIGRHSEIVALLTSLHHHSPQNPQFYCKNFFLLLLRIFAKSSEELYSNFSKSRLTLSPKWRQKFRWTFSFFQCSKKKETFSPFLLHFRMINDTNWFFFFCFLGSLESWGSVFACNDFFIKWKQEVIKKVLSSLEFNWKSLRAISKIKFWRNHVVSKEQLRKRIWSWCWWQVSINFLKLWIWTFKPC